jgi:hypothetical protein
MTNYEIEEKKSTTWNLFALIGDIKRGSNSDAIKNGHFSFLQPDECGMGRVTIETCFITDSFENESQFFPLKHCLDVKLCNCKGKYIFFITNAHS